MIEAPAGTAWYVYGVAEDDPALERLDGVELIRRGDLAAIVREVPLAEYGETVLPERLNDREWLERNARAHEDVLQGAAAVTAVVPLRFGTIYRSREHVGQMLGERSASSRRSSNGSASTSSSASRRGSTWAPSSRRSPLSRSPPRAAERARPISSSERASRSARASSPPAAPSSPRRRTGA